jgi:hypothetical protein
MVISLGFFKEDELAAAHGFDLAGFLVLLATHWTTSIALTQPMPGCAIVNVSNRLPDYSIVVWLRVGERFDELRSELQSVAGKEPYDSTQYQGMQDFHWGFDNLVEAQEFANALKHIAQSPEIVLLHIMSRIDGVESITLKDERTIKN